VRRQELFRDPFSNRLQDSLQHRFFIFQNIVITDSQESIILVLQTLLSFLIVFTTFAVTFSVEFDDQSGSGMIKVDDILFDRILPTELFALQPTVTKQRPEFLFRACHLSAQ